MLYARIMAKITTGIPLAIPNTPGKTHGILLCIANGSNAPKNKAADAGQKLNAKMHPSRKAPMKQDFSAILPKFRFEKSLLPKGIFIISSKNIPIMINKGPNAIFMYFCSICDICGV